MKKRLKKQKDKTKGFINEFKTFITRGNVLDLAVGVIIGGAFTAIVNGLSNFVLKPIINWVLALIFGSNSLDGIFTYLKVVTVVDPNTGAESIDLANSIYINWGEFINAIINFLLVALVLFLIIKIMNMLKDRHLKLQQKLAELSEKLMKEEEEAKAQEAVAETPAEPVAPDEPVITEKDLLVEIRDLLKAQAAPKKATKKSK
jgi:large conductance mechanosensitive channel